MTKSKGSMHERRVAKRFADEGWHVMRSPSSGGGTAREQPDLLASHPDRRPVAIEMKYGGDDRLYLAPNEGTDLVSFARSFGAIPLAAFRWKQDSTYYCRRISALEQTDAGSFVGVHDVAQDEGWNDGGLPNAVVGREVADD